jgi:Na+/proline symporter
MSTPTTASANTGPVGQRRGVLFVLLISLITIGIYTIYWAYKTQEEMKQHTGDGLGGVLGLVIWILLNPVSAFVIPSEVRKMYARDGRASPITGWTGLWLFPFGIFIIPLIVWFVKVQGALNRYWESKPAASAQA